MTPGSPFVELVNDLAASDPIRNRRCVYCPLGVQWMAGHAPDCLWERARRLTREMAPIIETRTVWLWGGADSLDGTTTEVPVIGDSVEIDTGGHRWTYMRSTMRVDGLPVWWHTTTTAIHPCFMDGA